jgi:hypothetical protein
MTLIKIMTKCTISVWKRSSPGLIMSASPEDPIEIETSEDMLRISIA